MLVLPVMTDWLNLLVALICSRTDLSYLCISVKDLR